MLHDLHCNVRMFFVSHTQSLLLNDHCHITSKLHCVVEAHATVCMHKSLIYNKFLQLMKTFMVELSFHCSLLLHECSVYQDLT